MKSKFQFSLRGIIITVLVILFFVGIILSYYFRLLAETRERIIKDGELHAVKSAEEIDQYLSYGIMTIDLACYTLDSMIRNGSSQAEIRNFLVNQTEAVSSTDMKTTGLYGYIRGEYLDGTDWKPDADYIPTERPWYIDARANVGRVAVVDPYIDVQTYKTAITFSRTLCDAKSVAAIDFFIDPLQKLTEEVSFRKNSRVTIVLDRNYRVIAHSDRTEIGNQYISEKGTLGSALVKELRKSGDNFFSMRYNNADYIVYAVSVSNDWLCLSVFDATTDFGHLKNMLVATIIVVILAVSILFFIMGQLNRKQMQFAQLSAHAVEAIAAAVDAKDSYTKGHSDRVARYATEIGRRYGYSKKQQDELHMMGLLHDVGKIGIPDAVINKSGKLTPEEFANIKKHPDIGGKILSKTTELSRLAMGARWHHERFDGTGYPDGLSKNDIPEEARIIAVADAYDAMTSRRSYRDALSQAVVRKEIEKGKGLQFDPVFADIMLAMIDADHDFQMRDLS